MALGERAGCQIRRIPCEQWWRRGLGDSLRKMSAATPSRRQPPKVRRPEPAPVAESALITGLTQQMHHHPTSDRQQAVDAFLGQHPTSPIVEPDPAGDAHHRIVTFVRQDATAAEVLLFVNRLTDETDLDRSLMQHVAGTDLWHLSYRMRDDWVASYSFNVAKAGELAPWRGQPDQRGIREALDHGEPDTRNPLTMTNRAGRRVSVVALEAAPGDHWSTPHGAPAGELTAHTGPDGRRLWMYLPAGGCGADGAPLLIMLDGDVWRGTQPLPTMLDNLIEAQAIAPVVAVFVDSADREQRWSELDEHGGIADWMADRLRPWLAELPNASITTDPQHTVVVGQSLGGLAALAAVVRRPDAFGGAIAQSAALWQTDVADEAAARPPREARIEIQVGLQEWVLLPPARAFAAQLAGDGVDVRLTEVNGGHDYAWWRRTLPDALQRLFAERGTR